jgi:N-acetylneuraminic acid mutarotase
VNNDLHRALDSVTHSPTPDFVTRLASEIEREMSGTSAEAMAVSQDVDILAAPGELGRRAPRHWRRPAAVLASAAVIAAAVAIANPFRHEAAPIHTGSTLIGTTTAPGPSATPISARTTSPTTINPTTSNGPNAMTVAPTPAEWEELPAAPLPRRAHPLVIAMGKEVLVVGGIDRSARVFEGAVLDRNSWRPIPSAPSALTDSVPAVWAGSAVVALGDDGHVVSFTPGSDRWEVLSTDATTPRTDATAVWTGSELLLAGGVDPRVAAIPGKELSLLEAVAFNPVTRSWRRLPVPPGTDPLLGPSAWSGTEWIRAASVPIDGKPALTKVAAFDPTTNRWRILPDLPGQVSALVRVGSSIAAYSQDKFGAVRFHLENDAWTYDGEVPTFEQTTTVKDAHVVDGIELATGYLTITYRQAGGGWGWIPNPISLAGDEKYVQTPGGDIVAYAAGKAARLRPISDPTVSLQRCNGRNFSSNIEPGADDATLVLINTGPACTFNQADERNLQFQVSASWSSPVEDRRLTRGGPGYIVEPQGRVTVNFANVDLEVYRRPCVSTPPTTGPIYKARFTLSSVGDPIELKVTVPAGCVGLAFSVAPAPPPEPPTTTTTSSRPKVPSDRWEALPDLPGRPMYKPLVVVLGTDVLVVGGYETLQADRAPTTTGALFDGKSWRVIPEAPVPLAAETSAVWTGSNLLVVSTEGTILTFTPRPDRWEVVGKAPAPNRFGAQVVWTDDEMLFSSGGVTGLNSEGGMNIIDDAVAYRPSTNTWRAIPRPPTKDPLTGKSVWTGNEWVRTVGWSEGKFEDFGSIAAYDPRSNRWRELPQLAADVPPTAILMEGGELVAYTRAERWRFDGEAWLSAGALPVPASDSGYGEAWFVNGQAIKTKADASGYFAALEGLDAKGLWQPLGEPFPGIRTDATMRTAGDRFVLISYGKAARLRLP